MAFERSWEAPMEFEYEHPPFLTYNVFDNCTPSPHPAPDTLFTTVTSRFLPKKWASSSDPATLLSSLSSIKLDDQRDNRSEIHDLEIKEEQQKQQQQQPPSPIVSPEPTSKSDTDNVPAVATNDTPSSTNNNDNDNNSLALVPQTEHDMIPAPQHQHLHQHLYPPPVLPDQKRNLVVFLSDMFILIRNIVIFALVLYLSIQFAITFQRDIALKMEIYESDRLEEHYHCRLEYMRNRCDPSTRLPALETQCREWQQCLYHPMWIGKTRILAETIAEICNGFVDAISTKTMIFMLSTFITVVWGLVSRSVRTHATSTQEYPLSIRQRSEK